MRRKTTKCRRKWARRGRGLADFLLSFVFTCLQYIADVVIGVLVFCWNEAVALVGFIRNWRAKADIERCDRALELADALVSLGVPKQRAMLKAAAVIKDRGVLPLEELVPIALA